MSSSSSSSCSSSNDVEVTSKVENDEIILQKSLLSDKAIIEHMNKGTVVIEPFNLANLSTSSYDVTLGEYYYRESVPEPGQGIYNLYSKEMVDRIWGKAQTAERAGDWMQRTKQNLENIDEDDLIIWIQPGTDDLDTDTPPITISAAIYSSIPSFESFCETILAHTNEFIGGRKTVTTMMKARSSMGRNFISVCKCFPPNVRLLTRDGYKFVEFITLDDEIGSYNPVSEQLEFHRPSHVIKKTGRHSMVKVKQEYANHTMYGGLEANNHIELATTDDHEWFVQFGKQEKNSQKVYYQHEGGKEKPYAKFPASNLTGNGKNENDCFRVLTSIANGRADSIKPNSDATTLPFAIKLGLNTNESVDAFLSFYGYWLGAGSITSGNVICTPTKSADKPYVRNLLIQMGLEPKNGFVEYSVFEGTVIHFMIRDKRYSDFFNHEYSSKEGLERTSDEEAIKSSEWFMDWVFTLDVRRLRLIIEGLVMADGRSVTREVIFSSSVRFRDQLMCILLYAGYAPYFRRYSEKEDTLVDGWQIFIGRRKSNKLKHKRDVTEFDYDGDVYCLTVPNNLVIAQTAKIENGVVIEASKSIIIGQCAGWGDIGYINRWTMEITSNSRSYSIPLVVGRRIAQIVFFDTDGTIKKHNKDEEHASYEQTGKYQTTSNFEELKAQWDPNSMLPQMYKDREVTEIVKNSNNSKEHSDVNAK